MAGMNKSSELPPVEGHADPSPCPTIGKGTFMGIGTCVPLSENAVSVNTKTGKNQLGE